VTLSGLPNLAALVGKQTGHFWLSYKLLGVLVQTDLFTDTANPGIAV
jgi:hypothetical protein